MPPPDKNPQLPAVLPARPVRLPDELRAEMVKGSQAMTTAYWSDQSLVVEIQDGHKPPKFRHLGQPFAVVGSASRATICIPSSQIAKRKYYLHATDDGVYCVDLVPTAGARDVVGWWLKPDEWLTVGKVKICVRLSNVPAHRTGARPNLSARRSLKWKHPTIQVLLDGRPIVDRPISRHLTFVGRARPCSFRIESRSVSAVHAALYWDQGQMWLIDLSSTSGIYLDSQPQIVTQITEREPVQVGHYQLRMVPFDTSGAPGRTLDQASEELESEADVVEEPSGSLAEATGDVLESAQPRLGDPLEAERSQLAQAQAQLEREIVAARDSRLRWDAETTAVLAQQQAIAQQREALESVQAKLDADATSLRALQQQVEAAQADRIAGQQQLARERDELCELREQLNANSGRLEQQQSELDSQLRDLELGRQQLGIEQEKLSQLRARLEEDLAQSMVARARWEAEAAQLATEVAQQQELAGATAANSRLAQATSAEMIAAREQLAREIAAVAEQRAQWESQSAQLAVDRELLEREMRQMQERRQIVEDSEQRLAISAKASEQALRAIGEERAQVEQARLAANEHERRLMAEAARVGIEQQRASEQQYEVDAARQQLEVERREVRAIRDRLEAELTQAAAARQRWESQAAALADEIDQHKRLADESAASARVVQAASVELDGLRAQLERETEAATTARRRWESELAAVSAHQKELDLARVEIEKSRRQAETETARWKAARDSLAAERTELEGYRQDVQRSRDEIAAARNELRREQEVLDERMRSMATQLAELSAARQKLVADEGQLEATRKRLDTEIAEAVAARQKWEAESGRLANELEQQQRVADVTATNNRLAQEATVELAALRSQLQREVAEAAAARTRWEDATARCADEHAELDRQRSELDAARRQAETDVARVAARRGQLDEEAAAVAAQRQALQAARSEAESLREQWELENTRLQVLRDQLQHRLTAADAARTEAESETTRLASVRERLEREIAESWESRQKWRAEYEQLAYELKQRRVPDVIEEPPYLVTPPPSRPLHDSEEWTMEDGKLVAVRRGGAAPPVRPNLVQVVVDDVADNDSDPAVSRELIEAHRSAAAAVESGELTGATTSPLGVSTSGSAFDAEIDEQAERMTAQLVRRTSTTHRRRILVYLLGFLVLAGIAASAVATVWINREKWLKKD